MKKILFLLTTLLAVSSSLCFAGCNDKGNTDGKTENDNVRTRIGTVDDNNDSTCPDCEERGMPKVRFEFKDGRPAGIKDGNDDVEPPHARHHKKHPHPHKNPIPAPPEDDSQDKDEN